MSVDHFDSFAAFDASVIALLGQASDSIRVFDVDLSIGPLAGARAAEMLSTMLHRNPKADVTFLLHQVRHVATQCPRLLNIYQRRTHQMKILQTSPRHRDFMQPFLVVDGQHVVTRFHADHARGKLCLDAPSEAAPFLFRFDELLESATPAPGLTVLNI
ncbi:MAG: hypothetical protein KDG55_07010 [Rhodocyclaceae bacterium]|nr:hypothetical protein [Rhodocyclaceae bacterium]